MIEQEDLQIVALAAESAKKWNRVEILLCDRALKVCLESALHRQGVRDVVIVDLNSLVRQLKKQIRLVIGDTAESRQDWVNSLFRTGL